MVRDNIIIFDTIPKKRLSEDIERVKQSYIVSYTGTPLYTYSKSYRIIVTEYL